MKKLMIFGLTVIMVTGAIYYCFTNRERAFIDRGFTQLNGGDGSEHVETINLNSGESIRVILEHACCSGGGFDAVVIKTSDGHEYYSHNNYCGIEGFYGAVASFKDLKQVKEYLLSSGYKKK